MCPVHRCRPHRRGRAAALLVAAATATALPATATATAKPATAKPAPAKPANPELERAEELYDNGRTLFAEGSYDDAATAFEQAYALSGNLDMLYNAMLAYDRANRFEEAIDALDRYRALAPASEREGLDARKKSLVVRLEKQREAEAAAGDAAAAGAPEPADTADPAPPSPPPRERRVAPRTWGVLGASAALAAIGTGLGVASLAFTRRGRGGCTDVTGELLCGEAVADDVLASRRLAIATDVTFALAGGMAIAFVALLAVDVRRSKRAEVRLVPAPGGLAVRW